MRALVLLGLVAGCYNPTVAPGAPCESTLDCPGGQLCVANVCGGTEPAIDAPPAELDASIDAPLDALNIIEYTLGDSIAEIRDTEIWDTAGNLGTVDHWSIDATETGLVWFDLTQIPTTKTVMSATLSVSVFDQADETGGTATVHRLRQAWVETEATWTARSAAASWTTAGALSPSSDTAAIGTFTPATIGATYDIVLPVAMVQAWVTTPAENFGLLFKRGTSVEHVHMSSREGLKPPKLVIKAY